MPFPVAAMLVVLMAAGCGGGGVPVDVPCAAMTGVATVGVQCSLERLSGTSTALAIFEDGTQIVIVTEPAVTGVILNPVDDGVTFTVYPRRCPRWSGRLSIDDSYAYAFDLICDDTEERATGYLRP